MYLLHKFKENGDSCLPLLNIIGELLCMTSSALFVLAFSTPAQSYFIFPYLHFPPPHICTSIPPSLPYPIPSHPLPFPPVPHFHPSGSISFSRSFFWLGRPLQIGSGYNLAGLSTQVNTPLYASIDRIRFRTRRHTFKSRDIFSRRSLISYKRKLTNCMLQRLLTQCNNLTMVHRRYTKYSALRRPKRPMT